MNEFAQYDDASCDNIFEILLYQLFLSHWLFFFFQAEDGIRDSSVTGVQTCALPIWTRHRRQQRRPDSLCREFLEGNHRHVRSYFQAGDAAGWIPGPGSAREFLSVEYPEIGRASCRERV